MKKINNIVFALVLFFAFDFGVEKVLRYGVDHYFGLNEYADMLLIGHSHLMLAVDKQKMEEELDIKISKYCREGVGVCDRYYMVKQYLDSPYSDSLKTMMYGVDLCTFLGEGLSSNSYVLFYPFIDNDDIGGFIRESTDAVDYWSHKIIRTYRYNDGTIMNAAIRGLRNDWSNKKVGVIDIEKYKQFIADGNERHIQMDPRIINKFKETIKMATDRGVRVILVNTPTLDILNEYEPDKFAEVCQWFQDFADNNDHVEYWDFNPEYSTRHEIFYDRLHVNVRGQEIINEAIIKKIKEGII